MKKGKRICGGTFVKKEKLCKTVGYLLLTSFSTINIANLLFDKVTIFKCISFIILIIVLAVFIVYFDT